MKNPVILIAALVIVLGAMFYLHGYSKRGDGEAESPQGAANTFTLGERIEIPHAGYGHEVHISPPSAAVDGEGNAYVAWSEAAHDSNNVYVVKPVTGEEKPVRVNPDGLSADSVHQSPGIATGPAGEVYVSWGSSKDKPEGVIFANDFRLSRSLDGGKSFDARYRHQRGQADFPLVRGHCRRRFGRRNSRVDRQQGRMGQAGHVPYGHIRPGHRCG